jgi:hypothetical protein
VVPGSANSDQSAAQQSGVGHLFRERVRDAEAGEYLDYRPVRLKLCQRRVELLQDGFVGLPGSEGCPDDP